VKRLLILALTLAACTTDIGGGGGGGSSAATPDAAPMAVPGEKSVARGMLWVQAMVPYCQAANHQPDYDSACSSTCTRPDVPDWDPYRSDCSGFVSWAWDLPAPGRVTSTFAPFKTDITHAIDGSELRPGDAINNSDHIMLFAEWVTPGMTAKFLEEPGCSVSQPYAREIMADVTISGQMITLASRGTYTAIRYDEAP
jgi:hypothetical protein